MTIVITSCSKRKRVPPATALCAGTLPSGSLDRVAGEWCSRVRAATGGRPALDLYSGRHFYEASRAARELQAELFIVSAGLGVLRSEDLAPPYSLTVTMGSPDNILGVVEGEITAADWWRCLCRRFDGRSDFAAAAASAGTTDDGIFLALPAPYLKMVEADLQEFSEEQLCRTRIFTGPSFRFRESALNRLLMPYDARLDGPDSPCPGTATDFPARALRHFATTLLPESPQGNYDEHADLVTRCLSGWAPPLRPERTRQSDSELQEIIRANWSHAGGSASQMLRWVRRRLGLACEQGRMRELYAVVRREMEEAS